MVINSTSCPSQWVDEWNYPCEYNFYKFVQDLDFGEGATLCTKHVQENWYDEPWILEQYRLAIKFKNILLGVKAMGFEGAFDLNFVYELAEMQLDKLSNLPLEEEITLGVDFTPGVGCVKPPTPEGENSSGNTQATGYCIPNRVDGENVCWGPCLLECSGVYPDGEIVGTDGCIPCVLVEGPSIGSPPSGTMEQVEKKSQ